MARGKRTQGQTTIYKTLNKKLKMESSWSNTNRTELIVNRKSYYIYDCLNCTHVNKRVCRGRIGTKFLRPLKGVNPAGTPEYRNGTESFFGLKGHPSVVRDV